MKEMLFIWVHSALQVVAPQGHNRSGYCVVFSDITVVEKASRLGLVSGVIPIIANTHAMYSVALYTRRAKVLSNRLQSKGK